RRGQRLAAAARRRRRLRRVRAQRHDARRALERVVSGGAPARERGPEPLMEVVYLLVLLAAALAGVILWAFFWSVGSGQFDDLEGPAHRVLMDDDEHPPKRG